MLPHRLTDNICLYTFKHISILIIVLLFLHIFMQATTRVKSSDERWPN